MRVLFFARSRDLAGADTIDLDVPPGTSVAELRRILTERFPRLATLMPHCAIAVDDDFVPEGAVLSASAEVAILPPVSGGQVPFDETV